MNKYDLEFYGKNFTLLVLNLYKYNLKNFKKYFKKKIIEFPNILKKTPIIINIMFYMKISDWILTKKLILYFKFKIIGFSSCINIDLKNYIIDSGIPYLNIGKENFLPNVKKKSNKNINNIHNKKNSSITINYPIRSGQKIYSKNSDLIIINNVSYGAEIISGKNIHIYGSLKGRAIAGSLGDLSAKIFCRFCYPELISIYNNYWLYDKIPKEFIGKSSYFFLKDNSLYVKKI
ncbi:septum site-determining protein MinC [Buchnera aphidicola (Ceratovacuna keduensis)]|uniref:septum site-determining protein MinC n=1 Tax=Buchnera aphidicola TaxID=9 RepID=UPI0031B88FF8